MDIRPMSDADTPALVEVSLAADTAFAAAGLDLPPDDPRHMLAEAEWVLVAGDPVCGFAALAEVDGRAHLEQLAVDPAFGSRGIGGALVEAACAEAAARGYRAMTLTTFRDLPWNAPWYARRRFRPLPEREWGPGLAVRWEQEVRAGVAVAPRIAMIRVWEDPALRP